jgi:pimeloyl-ACP methyl ester carboxylesterase
MIEDDAAFAAFARIVEPGSTYRNAVAARSILTFDDWNPRPHAERLRVPVLLVAAPADRFAPFAAVEAFARGRDHVTVERIPGDHFDVYSPPVRDMASAAAARFLTAALGAR